MQGRSIIESTTIIVVIYTNCTNEDRFTEQLVMVTDAPRANDHL